MKTTTRPRAASGELPAKTKKRKKKAPPRGFMCGCGGASSVSTVPRTAVSIVSSATATPARPAAPAADKASDAAEASAEGTPSVDSLLRQLRELERGVRALGVRERGGESCGGEASSTRTRPRRRRHATGDDSWSGVGVGVGRVDLDSESVAVVTESEDPLGDFRRSMAQMVVANGITGGAELRELLRRFLALNSACHHHLILRAFADVGEELFAGGHAVALAPPHPPRLPAGHGRRGKGLVQSR